ncbi:MAG: helix-turn-helix domain-containing protein [Candidatus Acidiferrales bacterium]
MATIPIWDSEVPYRRSPKNGLAARRLEMCGGNRVRASQILGIGRTSLYRFLKREPEQPAGKHAA